MERITSFKVSKNIHVSLNFQSVDYESFSKLQISTCLSESIYFSTRVVDWLGLEEVYLELVSKELNHLAAILHVYAGVLIFMK